MISPSNKNNESQSKKIAYKATEKCNQYCRQRTDQPLLTRSISSLETGANLELSVGSCYKVFVASFENIQIMFLSFTRFLKLVSREMNTNYTLLYFFGFYPYFTGKIIILCTLIYLAFRHFKYRQK